LTRVLQNLVETFAPLRFGVWPTPVQHLRAISGLPRLYVKRDDLSAELYGGSKVRNLEWIFGHARALGAPSFVTTAAWGSHLVLALALHGRAHGFGVRAALFPQPRDAEVEATLRRGRAAGATLVECSSYATVPSHLRAHVREARREEGVRPYFVAPGGASAIGSLGYVQAAFEIKEQVERGELPEPELIFCAAGSCGTLVGLAEGCALAGLRSRVVAVRVVPRVAALAAYVAWRRARLRRLLAVAGVRTATRTPIEIVAGFMGPGYGRPTPPALAVMDALRAELALDLTYTAKAFAGMLDYVRARGLESRPMLFIHTFDNRLHPAT
jgi:1-aminocyclopropane-1-carboxylate deaminase/D-cysteine desulfhydrase-like pyridoxal-dependent ACC family enzyme